MSTNYYYRSNEEDGETREIHIGKSAAGWAFALHGDKFLGLNTAADFAHLFEHGNGHIVDEYGNRLLAEQMMLMIFDIRPWPKPLIAQTDTCYVDKKQNLLHSKPDRYREVVNGDGTWDVFYHDFD